MDTTTTASVEKNAKPQWLRVKLPTGKKYTELRGQIPAQYDLYLRKLPQYGRVLGAWYGYLYDFG